MVIFKVHPIKKSVHSRNNGESENLSHLVMSDSVTPWAVAHQGPMSMGFSRQEYWSGMPFLPPGDLPYPGIKPMSPILAGGFFSPEYSLEGLMLKLKLLYFGHLMGRADSLMLGKIEGRRRKG